MHPYRRAGFSLLRDLAPGLGKRRPATPPAMQRRNISTRQITTIVILGILTTIVVLMFALCLLRMLRRKHNDPKYIPTPFLKRLWTRWKVPPTGAAYHPAAELDDTSTTDAASVRRPSRVRIGSAAFANGSTESQARTAGNTGNSDNGPDRQTSVRSIMTLPPYRVNPANTEQVIGREGERDGVDVVVEMPTEDAVEDLREHEMEALYQIRLARRQDIAEREERRRLRQEARQRGDVVALEELRARTRAAANNNTLVEELRRDHERLKDQRNRAVSSVSYAELGVARHDGTRIRANSIESERVGLLSDAASIGALSTHSGAASGHRRDRSSSVLSIDSDFPSPSLVSRSRASSRADTPRLSTSHTRAGSSPEVIEADLGEADMPPHSPPGYDVVSLDDQRSRATTPQNEPPPDYPGHLQTRGDRTGSQCEGQGQGSSIDLGADGNDSDDRGRRASRRGVDGAPQLPSLRIRGLPQIVIDASSDGAERG